MSFQGDHCMENLKMAGNFAVVWEMSEKNLVRENCYSVCIMHGMGS